MCKGEAGKGGVECPQKGAKLSSHGCHGLSQKDVCCSPVSLFAGKPQEKETKLLWVFPSYLNFLLSPFSRLVLGSACPLGDPRCPKPLPSNSWMAGESPGTCPSCGQPHLVQQKWEKCCSSGFMEVEGKLNSIGTPDGPPSSLLFCGNWIFHWPFAKNKEN